MAARKKRASSRKPKSKGPAKQSAGVRSAVAVGKARARETLERRAERRKVRARAVAAAARIQPSAAARGPKPTIRPRALGALAPRATAGVLIAEGDSWFDYPLNDVLSKLEDEHGFDVEAVAHKGDEIESMAFADGQLDDFSRLLEKVLAGGTVPRAILLSGGGNDIVGPEFRMLLNHAASPIAGLNENVVTGVIDDRIRTSLITIIAAVTAICEEFLSAPLPIVMHGYDYAVPDGRGVLGGFWKLPGPWMRPGFEQKGFDDVNANKRTVQALIDRYNTMAQATAGQFAHVHYVNLRGTLSNGPAYKTFWANELHPTKRGFGLVADAFAAVIAKLP